MPVATSSVDKQQAESYPDFWRYGEIFEVNPPEHISHQHVWENSAICLAVQRFQHNTCPLRILDPGKADICFNHGCSNEMIELWEIHLFLPYSFSPFLKKNKIKIKKAIPLQQPGVGQSRSHLWMICDEKSCQVHEFRKTRVAARTHGRCSSQLIKISSGVSSLPNVHGRGRGLWEEPVGNPQRHWGNN